MFEKKFLKKYNASIMEITMQTSYDSVNFELNKPWLNTNSNFGIQKEFTVQQFREINLESI